MLLLLTSCLYISDEEVLGRLGVDSGSHDTAIDTGPGDTGPGDTGPAGRSYADADGDGSGDPAIYSDQDPPPDGYVANAWDCADDDPAEPVWVATTGLTSAVGSFDDPQGSIGGGILTANRCVRIRGGTYLENIATSGKNIDILGVDGSAATVIQGTGQLSVLTVVGTETVTLSGVTLTGGLGTLAHETLPYYVGGGINVNGSTLGLTNVVVTGNTASTGGGMNASNATVTLQSVQFDANTAEVAGAIYMEAGKLTGDDVQLVGNTASVYAGAGALSGGIVGLTHLTVNANRATSGTDGVYAAGSTLTLTNTTFVDLDVALDVVGGTTTVINAIFAEAAVTIRFEEPQAYEVTYSDEFGYGGRTSETGNINLDPMFTDFIADGLWSADDLTLQAGSPCVDTGDPRIFDADGSRSDMGAAP